MFFQETAELLVRYSRRRILKRQLPDLAWTPAPYFITKNHIRSRSWVKE